MAYRYPELHGNEDEEPENAYEILEKKRQKEIEVFMNAFSVYLLYNLLLAPFLPF